MRVTEPPVTDRASHTALHESGALRDRVEAAYALLEECVLCGRQCRVDRTRSTRGARCRTGLNARVHEFRIARDVEPFLAGPVGAGIVEFGYCNLRCKTCGTPTINQDGGGVEMEPERIADGFLQLQEAGAAVLILRRPSHVIAQALAALDLADRRGFRLPVAYDSGGYDHPTGLALLEGAVDIYIAEMKFGNSGAGRMIARVRDYTAKNRAAIREMHRQVGDLVVGTDGIARRGLLVRHRVLPNGLSHSGPAFRFLAHEVSRNTAVRLVDGFEPVYQSADLPMLRRGLQDEEFDRAVALADRHGLRRRLD